MRFVGPKLVICNPYPHTIMECYFPKSPSAKIIENKCRPAEYRKEELEKTTRDKEEIEKAGDRTEELVLYYLGYLGEIFQE